MRGEGVPHDVPLSAVSPNLPEVLGTNRADGPFNDMDGEASREIW